MAAPQLQRKSAQLGTTATTVVAAVPALRALVVSRVIAVNGSTTATVTFSLSVGGAAIASNVQLAPGEVYSESGLVLQPAETLTGFASAASTVTVSVFGQEVDRG